MQVYPYQKQFIPFLLALMIVPASAQGLLPDATSAIVYETSTPRSSVSVDFFYVAKIDGKSVPNGLENTARSNAGRGISMTPEVVEHPVSIKPHIFTIYGRTHYSAPFLELAGEVYQISGQVRFTPEPGHMYFVVGKLTKEGSSIWIEDQTNMIMDKRIEVKGSAALGLFEK